MIIDDTFSWFSDPGELPLSQAIVSHLLLSVIAVAIATLLAAPTGWLIGHTGKGRTWVVGATGTARSLPTFGLLLFLVMILSVNHQLTAVIMCLVIIAIPPVLAGAYTGLDAIPRPVIDGARSFGMTEGQILARVEIPLGVPLLIGGLRSALLQVIATVTIAGYVADWGLGFYIIQGIQLRDFGQILGASLLVAALAVLIDAIMALIQHLLPTRIAQ